jgi:lipopolysaccharide/colanic/teichoic acid biosynthesis glycosyltransferase
MKVGAENNRQFAGYKNDPRITRVGKVIRLFRIDEIPQMWNVMKGDMSFIGPRALMEEEVEAFVPRVPYFSLRHSVRPGVTGWAQINYPHGATEEDALAKLEYDLYYIKNLSSILDLMILARTIRTVLFGKGAR